MFSNVSHGWATFKLGDFVGQVSYLTDPIFEIADILIKGNGVVTMDEEGSTFDLIVSDMECYVVSHREKHELWTIENKWIEDIALEFIEDVERDIDDWVNWTYEPNELIIQERRKDILATLEILKDIYKE